VDWRVDTLTHALSGVLVGRLLAPAAHGRSATRPATWQIVAAGAVAAAFPDSDYLFSFVSELSYLRHHRGITHSLLLLPLWAWSLSWLLSLAMTPRTARANWRRFYPVVCAGILIHILGDYITQFGTMLLAPLSDRRFELGSVFIIDLAFSGIIVAGLIGSAVWRRSRLPAALALCALVGWVGVTLVGKQQAIDAGRAYAAAHGLSAARVDAVPQPLSPFNWSVIVDEAGERYHLAYLNTRRSRPLTARDDDSLFHRIRAAFLPVDLAEWQVRERFGDAHTAALAHAVWQADEFAFFRWFAMFPAVERVWRDEQTPEEARGDCVDFFDLRFSTPGRAGKPFVYGLCGSDAAGWRLFRDDGNAHRRIDPH